VSVSAAKSEPPTPRSRTLARAAQQREQERAACKKERATRHRMRRERRSEEYRLCEQQGLSSPGTEEYSSSDEEEEEEEEVRGQALPDRWEPSPPSPEPAPMEGRHRLGQAPRARPQAIDDRGGAGRGGAGARLGGVHLCGGGARACGGDGGRRGGGRTGRTRNVCGDLEEEEARLLFLEVRDCLSGGRVLVRQKSDSLFASPQGVANCASPRTGQGVEGGRVHPHPAAFIEGAAGGSERGGNSEQELARCS
jgi:hypothetical protein